jgi:hypothetical protein
MGLMGDSFMCTYRHVLTDTGFGLVTRFIEHLKPEITSNYKRFTNLRTVQFVVASVKCSHFVLVLVPRNHLPTV